MQLLNQNLISEQENNEISFSVVGKINKKWRSILTKEIIKTDHRIHR